eukprot:scaffold24832_cov121-Isochrysis_galbana.AAC.2
MAAMYLTHRAKTGADRPRDEHVEVERMCSSPMFRPARNPHPSLTWPCSSHYPNPPLSPSRTCPLDPPLWSSYSRRRPRNTPISTTGYSALRPPCRSGDGDGCRSLRGRFKSACGTPMHPASGAREEVNAPVRSCRLSALVAAPPNAPTPLLPGAPHAGGAEAAQRA